MIFRYASEREIEKDVSQISKKISEFEGELDPRWTLGLGGEPYWLNSLFYITKETTKDQ